MTVPATTRKAGPFNGNGSATSFAFTFKVFTDEDIQVVRANASGVETILVLDSDYSVTLNGDQNVSPGGTVTYPIAGAPLPTGWKLTIVGALDYGQETDLPTGGNFNPTVVEDALDKLSMQIQQVAEEVDRAVKVDVTSGGDPDALLDSINDAVADADAYATAAAASAAAAAASYDSFDDRYLGPKASNPTLDNDGNALITGALYFNTSTNVMRVYTGLVWQDVQQGVSFPFQTFSGNGSTTAFTLNSNPGALAAIEVFISGVRQVPTTNYTWSGGTTLTFVVAPPSGTNNIFVRWVVTQALTVPSDGSVTLVKLSASGTPSADTYLRGDNTWAELGLRRGITTVTLTSGAPNATLTAASNQLINIVTDSTTPISPSITLPAMTSLVTGQDYFVFCNNTPYVIALKDSGGTTRQFLPPGANQDLNIFNNSTATGQWATAIPTPVVSAEAYNRQTLPNNNQFIRLDSTNWAAVYGGPSSNLVARLYTINATTKVITAGNTVTLHTSTNNNYGVVADSDNAGHALVCFVHQSNTQNIVGYVGLSVSGGTLYASTATTVTAGLGCDNVRGIIYCGYLGSNNAFAMAMVVGSGGGGIAYLRGCTVTGTTTVTVTNSASNTSIANVSANAGSRTSLTDFTYFGLNLGTTNVGRAISYNPAANTFTVTTRTNQAQLAIEQLGDWSSFAGAGFLYCNGKAVYGGNVYDITNSGAAGVTSTLSTSLSVKNLIAPAYQTTNGANAFSSTARTSYQVSASQIVVLDGYGAGGINYYIVDPSSSTFNAQRGALTTSLSTANFANAYPHLLSANLGVLMNGSLSFVNPVDVATPIAV